MEIKKEKNFIKFILEKNKEYVIDINTAEVIGLRGKTLANMPKAVISALKEAEYGTIGIYALIPLIQKVRSYGNISLGTLEDLRPIIGLFDALQSVGFVPTDTRTEGAKWAFHNLSYISMNIVKQINPHEFLKWAEKRNEEGHGANFNSLYVYTQEVMQDMKKNLFNPKTEREEEILNTLFKTHILDYHSYEQLKNNLEEFTLTFKMYSQNKFFEVDKNHRDYWSSSALSMCRSMVSQIIEMCKDWEKPLPTKDLFRFYTDNIESYKLWKEENKDEIFKRNQLKKDLTFTYGDFTVVVPTKTFDLVEEGEKMHHCVGNGSYTQGVIKGKYNIVFIRKKDDINTPYITVQVYKDATFGGYYKAWDKPADLKEDIEFRKAYANYLKTIL